jgi:hypothetical protein
MPITKTVTLYTFDELNDKAKEKARDWWRSCRDSQDLDCAIDDFEIICGLLGIKLKQREFKTIGGTTRSEPDVSWSLGYSQSDFASFDGFYQNKADAVQSIREYAPQDETLRGIAEGLEAIQKRNGGHLLATIKHHHYYGQQVETKLDDSHEETEGKEVSDEDYKAVKCAVRELSAWFYNALRTEDEYQSSDKYIDESLEINDYTFREDGTRED